MPSNSGYQPLLNSHQSPSSNQSLRPLFIDEICLNGTPAPPLKIGDKVVWLSDSGPEYGVVKWLGKLPDVGSDWMAGVDFVNPIGSGTGLYQEYQLFQAKMNHASLVPIAGLMRAADYQGSSSNNIKFDNVLVPPLKPKRTKKAETSKFYTNESNKNSFLCNKDISQAISDKKVSGGYHSTVIANISNNLADFKLIDHQKDRDDGQQKISALGLEPNLTKASECLVHKSNNQSRLITVYNKKDSVSPMNSDVSDSHQTGSALSKTQNGSTILVEQECHDDNDTKNESSNDDELFEIGSVVEVGINSTFYHGVIRWLGFLKNDLDYKIDSIRKSDKHFKNVVAGIELEEEITGLTDGTLNGRRYFSCPMNKAYFVSLNECSKDSRFCCTNGTSLGNGSTFLDNKQCDSSLFGSIDCPTVLGDVAPLNLEDLTRLCGKNRGIQGHHNSCYLDATLFAMFSFSSIFESLLNRPKRPNDIPEYNEVQRILKEEIVNPLRSNLYVRADRVMHLRQLLEKISSVRGLTSEEKDPEEFINLLLSEILKTDPFLKLSSGLESLFYQLFVEKDESLQLPNVQQLFDQSFLASDIKLREVPSCLMIQMPRFGRDFKMYPKIIPSLYLDITNVLDNSPRQCIICGQLAQVECKACFGKFGEGLDSITFCIECFSTTHKKRTKQHQTTKLSIPPEFAMLQDHTNIPRVMMELFAVLCIETSHYVSFVKCGTEHDSPWCFFDSMADRKGEQNGYNIPEVVAFSDLKWWLSKEGQNHLLTNRDEKLIPELPRRLFSDAYICFYSSEVLRYR